MIAVERALGHLLQLVDRLVRDDALEQVDVLLDVGVDLALDADARRWSAPVNRKSLLATVPLVPTIVSETLLAQPSIWRAMLRTWTPFGELVIDREVVVALAALGLGVDLAAAHADGPDRVGAQRPDGDVEVVHVLLDDVVAAEPEEVVPVAELVLGVAPARLALAGPDVPLVPVDAGRDQVADRARRGSASCSRGSAAWWRRWVPATTQRLLLLGLLVGGQHLADAGAVDADRLLGEEVLAGLDRRLDVLGPEARAAWPASPGRSSR